MGRFPQDGEFCSIMSLFRNLCWTAVTKPDLLRHFFCGEHDSLITLPQPQPPPIHHNALQCIQNAPKMHCFVSIVTVHFWCILNALQCVPRATHRTLARWLGSGHSSIEEDLLRRWPKFYQLLLNGPSPEAAILARVAAADLTHIQDIIDNLCKN